MLGLRREGEEGKPPTELEAFGGAGGGDEGKNEDLHSVTFVHSSQRLFKPTTRGRSCSARMRKNLSGEGRKLFRLCHRIEKKTIVRGGHSIEKRLIASRSFIRLSLPDSSPLR